MRPYLAASAAQSQVPDIGSHQDPAAKPVAAGVGVAADGELGEGQVDASCWPGSVPLASPWLLIQLWWCNSFLH